MTTNNVRFVAKNGLDNNANSITNLGLTGAHFALAGANPLTLTTTGTTNVTLPTSGTLLTTTGSAASLTSFPTFNQNTTGSAGSVTNALTMNNSGTGAASGTTYNGSGAITISYNSVGASPLAGSASLTTTGTVTSGTWSGSFGAVSGANLTSLTAANLTGTTLPSSIVSSSLTSVGTLTSLAVTGAVTAGSFSGPLTGTVTGHASLDLPLTGGSLSGALAGPQFTTNGTVSSPGFQQAGTITAAAGTAYAFLSRGTLAAAVNGDALFGYDSSSGTAATGTFTGLSFYAGRFSGSSWAKTGTGTIATAYGVYADAPTIGTTNYAAYFNGATNVAGILTATYSGASGATYGANQAIRLDSNANTGYAVGVPATGNIVGGYYIAAGATTYAGGIEYQGTTNILSLRASNANIAAVSTSGISVTGNLSTTDTITVRKNATGAYLTTGRTANESFFGTSAATNDIVTGSAAGDTVILANTTSSSLILSSYSTGKIVVSATGAAVTGTLSATTFSGAGTSLTGTAASLTAGAVSSITSGQVTTALGFTPISGVGINSSGSGAVSNVLFSNVTLGTSTANVSANASFTYNQNTGLLSATTFAGAGTSLTGTAASLTAGLATSVAGGAANQIHYQTGAGATSFITAPSVSSTFLQWTGSAFAWAAAGGGFSSTDDTTTNATYYPAIITSAGGSTAKTSSTKLTFNPSTGTLSATVFNSLSDARAKTNIRALGYGLDDVLKMVGHKYEMIDGGQTSIGLIAQEVQDIVPEVVSANTDGMLGINYPVLTAVLIEAIKDLTARLAILEAKV